MGGLFAKWQPVYEEAGLVLFPVRPDKVPLISGYMKVGTRRSRELVEKFSDADAMGFACGAKGRGRRLALTVLDVDEPSEKLLADAIDRFGQTPIVARTATGKFHAWYRHNGERRKIKVPDMGGDIDILGGGMAIAPPSSTGKGSYEFIQGSLADVGSLPVMQSSVIPDLGGKPALPSEKTAEGKRNDVLFRYCMRQARDCANFDELLAYAQAMNATCEKQLPPDEIVGLVTNVWGKTQDGTNWFSEGQRVDLRHDILDRLLPLGPDVVALYLYLRRMHWGRDFVAANAMAEHMPGKAMPLPRFRAARKALEKFGFIEVVSAAGGKGNPAIYRFPKSPILPHAGFQGV